MDTQSYGLALSGDGARSFAHIGVFKALEEFGIQPEVISGTSMGAVLGAFIAAGYTFSELEKIIKNRSQSGLLKMVLPNLEVASHEPIRKILKEFLPENIEDLKIPMHISATNLTLGKNVIFTKGNLADAAIASCSIPITFKPIQINGDYYVDGGFTKNLPASTIRSKCEVLIGSQVNFIDKKTDIDSISNILERCFRIGINNSVRTDRAVCNLLIEPQGVEQFDPLNFRESAKIIDIGYHAAHKVLKQFQEDLNYKP